MVGSRGRPRGRGSGGGKRVRGRPKLESKISSSVESKEREDLLALLFEEDEFDKVTEDGKIIFDTRFTSPGSSLHDDSSGEEWSPSKEEDINDNIFSPVREGKFDEEANPFSKGNSPGKETDDPQENWPRNAELSVSKTSPSINGITSTPIEPGILAPKTLLTDVVTIADRNGLRCLKPLKKKIVPQISSNRSKPPGPVETSSSMGIILKRKDCFKHPPVLPGSFNPPKESIPERHDSQTSVLRFNQTQISAVRCLKDTMGDRFKDVIRVAEESPGLYGEIIVLSD